MNLFFRTLIFALLLQATLSYASCNVVPKPTIPGKLDNQLTQVQNYRTCFIQGTLKDIVTDPIYQRHVWNLYLFFGTLLLITHVTKMMFSGGVSLAKFVEPAQILIFTALLISIYEPLSQALFDWSEGIADLIQKNLLINTTAKSGKIEDLLGVVESIFNQLLNNGGIFTLIGLVIFTPQMLPIVIGMVIAFIALMIMASLGAMWSFWGFMIAKVVGPLFIPFSMFKRLSFLFEGWLNFFFGFLMYGLVTRVNIILVTIVISTAFVDLMAWPAAIVGDVVNAVASNATGVVFTPSNTSNPMALIGLTVFACIGVLSLFASGSFASTIIGGAGGGGLGGAIMSGITAVSRGSQIAGKVGLKVNKTFDAEGRLASTQRTFLNKTVTKNFNAAGAVTGTTMRYSNGIINRIQGNAGMGTSSYIKDGKEFSMTMDKFGNEFGTAKDLKTGDISQVRTSVQPNRDRITTTTNSDGSKVIQGSSEDGSRQWTSKLDDFGQPIENQSKTLQADGNFEVINTKFGADGSIQQDSVKVVDREGNEISSQSAGINEKGETFYKQKNEDGSSNQYERGKEADTFRTVDTEGGEFKATMQKETDGAGAERYTGNFTASGKTSEVYAFRDETGAPKVGEATKDVKISSEGDKFTMKENTQFDDGRTESAQRTKDAESGDFSVKRQATSASGGTESSTYEKQGDTENMAKGNTNSDGVNLGWSANQNAATGDVSDLKVSFPLNGRQATEQNGVLTSTNAAGEKFSLPIPDGGTRHFRDDGAMAYVYDGHKDASGASLSGAISVTDNGNMIGKLTVTNSAGASVTHSYSEDSNGRQSFTVVDSQGNTTGHTHDDFGNKVTMTHDSHQTDVGGYSFSTGKTSDGSMHEVGVVVTDDGKALKAEHFDGGFTDPVTKMYAERDITQVEGINYGEVKIPGNNERELVGEYDGGQAKFSVEGENYAMHNAGMDDHYNVKENGNFELVTNLDGVRIQINGESLDGKLTEAQATFTGKNGEVGTLDVRYDYTPQGDLSEIKTTNHDTQEVMRISPNDNAAAIFLPDAAAAEDKFKATVNTEAPKATYERDLTDAMRSDPGKFFPEKNSGKGKK